MSLTVKEVIQVARSHFLELLPALAIYPEPPGPKSITSKMTPAVKRSWLESSIRLEELEREEGNWAVTLSVPNPDFKEGDLLEGIRQARRLARVAKVLIIDGETGTLVALRDIQERAA
jgi:hypothetical protein